jgi:CRISPR-associated protein Cas1
MTQSRDHPREWHGHLQVCSANDVCRTTAAMALERLAWLMGRVTASGTAERIRGLEGNAALEYQRALGVLLAENGFTVLGRHYRPPTSPFDAMSSYGYGVLAE